MGAQVPFDMALLPLLVTGMLVGSAIDFHFLATLFSPKKNMMTLQLCRYVELGPREHAQVH